MDRYFYSVEMDGNRKIIHMLGNIYFNGDDETDEHYRHAEWTGLYLTPDEVITLHKKLYFYDYIDERVAYLSDLTQDEMINACKTYFNGDPGKMLHITSVNENTQCGDYWF